MLKLRSTDNKNILSWYRELCHTIYGADWKPTPSLITKNQKIIPFLLRIAWNGCSVYFDEKNWYCLVKNELEIGEKYEMIKIESENVKIKISFLDIHFNK